MPLLEPLWMQAAAGVPPEYAAQLDRIGLAAIFTAEGVHGPEFGALTINPREEGANLSVDIAPGYCVIKGDDISDQGMYVCASTTKLNLPVPPKPATGMRSHRVIARIRDGQANAAWGDTYDWTVEFLPEAGAGLPPMPPSAIHLGWVVMTSTTVSIQTGNITVDPQRAIVGTPDRKGTFSLNPAVWRATQAQRGLTYSINSEGWVSLAGWVVRVGPTFTCRMNVVYDENPGHRLPPEIRPIGPLRDVPGYSHAGTFHWRVWPDGKLEMRWPHGDVRLVTNEAWLTFDNINYRTRS